MLLPLFLLFSGFYIFSVMLFLWNRSEWVEFSISKFEFYIWWVKIPSAFFSCSEREKGLYFQSEIRETTLQPFEYFAQIFSVVLFYRFGQVKFMYLTLTCIWLLMYIWLWASYLTSLSLHSFISKWRSNTRLL